MQTGMAMSTEQLMTWSEIGDLVQKCELDVKGIALCKLLAQIVRDSEDQFMSDSDVGVLLLVIGEKFLKGAIK